MEIVLRRNMTNDKIIEIVSYDQHDTEYDNPIVWAVVSEDLISGMSFGYNERRALDFNGLKMELTIKKGAI